MSRTFTAALVVCLALVRCAWDAPAGFDAGAFACGADLACAPGWFCLEGTCVPDGSPRPGAGGGGGGSPFRAALRFTSPPRAVGMSACSDPVTFGLFDDVGAPLTAPADVEVTVAAPGLAVFSDTACSSPLTATVPVRILGSLHFTGATAGTFGITLSGPGLDLATQQQTVVSPGAPHLAFTGGPGPALAGECVGPLVVELRDGLGVPFAAPDGGITLSLSSQPPGLLFSPGSGCMPGPVTVSAGSAGVGFSVRSPTGRDYTVTASAPGFDAGTAAVSLRPVVRSGTCNLGANDLIKTCAVTPPVLDVTRTFLVYQSSPTAIEPGSASVACLLGDAGSVTCQRAVDGGTASVTWQTAELPGARVDRYDFGCATDGGTAFTIPLTPAVPLDRHFLLSAVSNAGLELDFSDLFTVTPSPSQLTVRWSNGCAARRGQLQLVRVPGFTTHRVTGAMTMGQLEALDGGLPALDGGAFALGNWRTPWPGFPNPRLCDRMLRFEASGADGVHVSRGAGNSSTQCREFDVDEWVVERVDVGQRGRVQAVTVALDAGVSSAVQAIAAIDLTRTVVFASGQSGGAGQGVGESAHNIDGGGFLGEASVTLKLNSATEVQLDRAGARSPAAFTIYVVELEP